MDDVRIICPNCGTFLRLALIDEGPEDQVVIKPECPHCGHVIPVYLLEA